MDPLRFLLQSCKVKVESKASKEAHKDALIQNSDRVLVSNNNPDPEPERTEEDIENTKLEEESHNGSVNLHLYSSPNENSDKSENFEPDVVTDNRKEFLELENSSDKCKKSKSKEVKNAEFVKPRSEPVKLVLSTVAANFYFNLISASEPVTNVSSLKTPRKEIDVKDAETVNHNGSKNSSIKECKIFLERCDKSEKVKAEKARLSKAGSRVKTKGAHAKKTKKGPSKPKQAAVIRNNAFSHKAVGSSSPIPYMASRSFAQIIKGKSFRHRYRPTSTSGTTSKPAPAVRKTRIKKRPSQNKSLQFQCEICNKYFNRSYRLRLHFRIHTGEMPYECQFCKRKFTYLGNRNVHVRNVCGKQGGLEKMSTHEATESQSQSSLCINNIKNEPLMTNTKYMQT